MPWAVDPRDASNNDSFPMRGFRNNPDIPVSLNELERQYCTLTGFSYPITEMPFVLSWVLFRVSASRNVNMLYLSIPLRSWRSFRRELQRDMRGDRRAQKKPLYMCNFSPFSAIWLVWC